MGPRYQARETKVAPTPRLETLPRPLPLLSSDFGPNGVLSCLIDPWGWTKGLLDLITNGGVLALFNFTLRLDWPPNWRTDYIEQTDMDEQEPWAELRILHGFANFGISVWNSEYGWVSHGMAAVLLPFASHMKSHGEHFISIEKEIWIFLHNSRRRHSSETGKNVPVSKWQ